MGYRVELLGISDFLSVQYTLAWQGLLRYWPYKRIILEEHTPDRKITKLVWYRRTVPAYGTLLQQSHNTVPVPYSDRYFSFTEAFVAYAGTVNYRVKVQPWILLLNLHFYISQVNVACGGGGSCEFVAAASAKFEIWRGPNVVLRFLRLYHWKPL
jgi:hypothetical protein